MSGSCRARMPWAPAFVLVLAAGCQSYNFNPVDACILQPGTSTETLSNISTADVLFVLDDSGSMSAEQQRLAQNFSAFINNLDQANAARGAAGLEPFDFHIAVTTTSVYYNPETTPATTECMSDSDCCATPPCAGATGRLICCLTSADPDRPVTQPKACTGPDDTSCPTGTGWSTECRMDCEGLKGEYYCCSADPAGWIPPAANTDVLSCSRADSACGKYGRHFVFIKDGAVPPNLLCIPGVAVEGWPYDRGNFVSWSESGGPGVNPRVLHFDKSLYPNPVAIDPPRTCAVPADCLAGEEVCVPETPAPGAPKICMKTLNRPCTLSTECATEQTCVAAISATGAPKFCRQSCTTSCPDGFTCVTSLSACQPTNTQGFTSQDLVNFFAGPGGSGANANVVVGTCGSAQEQGLTAARLALEKALASPKQQKDTFSMASGKVKTWDASTRTASSDAAWPHGGSKLVLVFVGDEDDCSSPEDPSGGVVLSGTTGADSCVSDSSPTGAHKQYEIASFVDYFLGLGRPVAAAFVEAAEQTACGYGSLLACTVDSGTSPVPCCQQDCPFTGVCRSTTDSFFCGGQALGKRFFQAASQLRSRGAEVFTGSICDSNFAALLQEIGELVRPPSGLELPTMPAGSDITVLRIVAGETTRKICNGPLLPRSPPNYTLDEAKAALDGQGNRYDWWFTVDDLPGPPVSVSRHVYINPDGACKANPGETYSAEYIGRLPAEGCSGATPQDADEQCWTALGGNTDSWTCFAGVDGAGRCLSTASTTGTCLCGARSKNCPNGTP